jgi:hypothetical protein
MLRQLLSRSPIIVTRVLVLVLLLAPSAFIVRVRSGRLVVEARRARSGGFGLALGRGERCIGGVGDFCTAAGGAGGWGGRKNGFGPPAAGTGGVAAAPCPSLKGFVLDGVVTSAGGGGGGGGTDTGGLVTTAGGAGGGGGGAIALFCSCRARRLASNRSCSSLAPLLPSQVQANALSGPHAFSLILPRAL